MKKLFILILLTLGFAVSSVAQTAGTGSGEKTVFKKRKARKQMKHFEKQKKDPNMKHNGTSYYRNKKSRYKVDGDGPSGNQKRTRRSRKNGIQ